MSRNSLGPISFLLLLHLLLLLLDFGLEALIHAPKDEEHDTQDKAEPGGRDGDIIWDFHFGGALFLSARNTGCVKRQMLFIFEILGKRPASNRSSLLVFP